MRVTGRGVAEDNFANERRSLLQIFVREATQNPADARKQGYEGPVEVRLQLLRAGEFDETYLHTLVNDEYLKRLNLATPGKVKFGRPQAPGVLVLEDFGTT